MKRKLIAALACRNQGSRLYGKPLQNLDVNKQIRIIDNIVDCIKSLDCIDDIVFGISEGVENEIYKSIASDKRLSFIVGDQKDVLSRLISCGNVTNATDIFRVTSESPFLYFNPVSSLWEKHKHEEADATFMDGIIDGCGFEILSMKALEYSHINGSEKHRSELCSLFIRENLTKFNVIKGTPPNSLVRKDLRLTVDNPEDLIVCKEVFQEFKDYAPLIPLEKVVRYLDRMPKLKELIAPYVESGYSTMYL